MLVPILRGRALVMLGHDTFSNAVVVTALTLAIWPRARWDTCIRPILLASEGRAGVLEAGYLRPAGAANGPGVSP